MFEVRQTEAFADWLRGLKDRTATIRIAQRIQRLALGNLGDARSVGDGVSEARLHIGPRYRLYFVRHGKVLIVLL